MKNRDTYGFCAWHTPADIPYMDFVAWCRRQERKGLKQRQCPDCQRWLFPSEYGVRPVLDVQAELSKAAPGADELNRSIARQFRCPY